MMDIYRGRAAEVNNRIKAPPEKFAGSRKPFHGPLEEMVGGPNIERMPQISVIDVHCGTRMALKS
jgi:hypothetical protein